MYYLSFNDTGIYEKSKHTIMLTTHDIESDVVIVDIQNIGPDHDWHSMLPAESHFKSLEESNSKESILFWSKFRKSHKRKEYTQEEFKKHFTILSKTT